MLPTIQRRKRIIRYVILTVSSIIRITAGWIQWTFSQNLEHLAQVWSTCLKGQYTSQRSFTKVWFCFSEILWWWGLSQKSFSPVVQIFCLQGQPIRKVALKQLITQKGWTGVCTKALYNVEKDFLKIMNNAKLLWSQTIKIRCLKWKE